METTKRRRIFRDIVRGYSSTIIDDKEVFVKHLTPHDQVELEEIEERYHQIALKRGVPTEEEMLAYLKEEGEWTKEDEKVIEDKKFFIQSLSQAKSKMVIKHEIDKQTELIQKEQFELNKKEAQKISLIGSTCEKYAKDRLNDFYMMRSFYLDKTLKKPMFSEDEFNELEDINLKRIILVYNDIFTMFEETSVQYTILEDFYSAYLSFAEDSIQFYGKPFCKLTYNQIRLITYTRIFKNIFDTNDNIPESIRKDPTKLLEFGGSSREERDQAKQKLSEGDGGTLVGAKDEDYAYLGIEKPSGGVDLHEEAKKKGGTLDMNDLMKLHGVE